MTDSPSIAVAHYPEGAGHATRMLAIADELRSSGADVEMAGGGAGARFVALNGYDEFAPTTVDYIDTYQGGSMHRVLTESVPATVGRVTDYIEWLRDRDFDALVTDDMFAAMAAIRTDVPLYVLKHDMPGLYRDPVERAGASFHTGFQLTAARAFFYPAVWPATDADPADATRVPPVALDGDAPEHETAEVVVVPSHYSDLGRIADNLRRQGHDVTDVGGDEWDPVPSLLPYLRGADVVVCSGYSTVMDAAVAGTPCVVHPATDEQEAVAGTLDRSDVTGFAVAEEPLDVLEAVAAPPDPPAHENGAPVVAAAVLDDLDARTRRPGERRAPDADDRTANASGAGGAPGRERDTAVDLAARRLGETRRRAADRTVAGAVALGTATHAAVRRGRRYLLDAARRSSEAVAATRGHAARTCRAIAERTRATTAAATAATRTTATSLRRWTAAVAAVSAALFVFSRGAAGRTGGRLSRAVTRAATGPRAGAIRCRRGAAAVAAAARDGVSTVLEGATRLARRLADGTRSTE